ncbi:hypothetical protein ISN76_13060 [Dyella halodurans]|uniref:Uncharacterized protein n=1 Tax=Dyella halodurans TaxID=1920171 RepID=A0ABV9C0E1_9GAMM|nr:hypothetical protein [Dyella halodurans]
MILKQLDIRVIEWGDDKGKYKGTAKFGDDRGEVALNLSPDHIDEIFKVCAVGIIETARRAASDMTCAIIEQKTTIDPPSPVQIDKSVGGRLKRLLSGDAQ